MLKASRIFLQSATVLFGGCVLALLLLVPPHEGRNVNAALFDVYFKDPFLAYVYLGSIPFFAALYRAFRLLGNLGRNEVFTAGNIKALRTIRYCALAAAVLAAGAVVYIRVTAPAGEDPAGFVIPGTFAVLASLAAAAAAAVVENVVRNVMEKHSAGH